MGQRRAARRLVNLALGLATVGLVLTLLLGLSGESHRAIAAPGGLDTLIGRFAGLAGAYLMLVMVLLMARIPALERAVGQDRLSRWHRFIGGWPIVLITAHMCFIIFGYAGAAQAGVLRQSWTFIRQYPDVLAAFVAFGLLVMAGVASFRIARRKMAYETWWAVHLYMYLALSLAFFHQIATGAAFVNHAVNRVIWSALWAATAGTVIVFRIAMPLWRSLRHRLKVVAVREEGPGVASIVLSGHHLDRLKVRGGQFFQWRFLVRGLWWQAHPYSISAMPAGNFLRLTVRTGGDHGAALLDLRPGTRVAIEGPYGAFTVRRRVSDGVLLIGAGVGVTPLRSLLEELPEHVDVEVIVRASDRSGLVLHDELTGLTDARGGRLHEVLGSRHDVRFDARLISKLVPDVVRRDIYLCGPDELAAELASALRRLGVAKERIHRESFAF